MSARELKETQLNETPYSRMVTKVLGLFQVRGFLYNKGARMIAMWCGVKGSERAYLFHLNMAGIVESIDVHNPAPCAIYPVVCTMDYKHGAPWDVAYIQKDGDVAPWMGDEEVVFINAVAEYISNGERSHGALSELFYDIVREGKNAPITVRSEFNTRLVNSISRFKNPETHQKLMGTIPSVVIDYDKISCFCGHYSANAVYSAHTWINNFGWDNDYLIARFNELPCDKKLYAIAEEVRLDALSGDGIDETDRTLHSREYL